MVDEAPAEVDIGSFEEISRACKTCSGGAGPGRGRGRKAKPRPCAIFQMVEDVPTVVFLPLPDRLRRGREYTDKAFWIAKT